jgi:hypothetical protein
MNTFDAAASIYPIKKILITLASLFRVFDKSEWLSALRNRSKVRTLMFGSHLDRERMNF